MEKTGRVCRADELSAEILIERDSACGENCAACGICKGAKEMKVTVKNTDGLRVGDSVTLITDDKKVLLRSAVGYLSLTAYLLLGGVVGNSLYGDWGAFLGAAAGVALGIAVLKVCIRQDMAVEVRKNGE